MNKFKVAFWKRFWMACTGKMLYVYWNSNTKQIETSFTFDSEGYVIATITGGFSIPPKPCKVVYNSDPHYTQVKKFLNEVKFI